VLSDADVIGFYFSASWCGPCKQFTPVLAQFYNNLKKQGTSSLNLEIVFVSADKSPEDFVKYFSQMPWLSVVWENVDAVSELTALALEVRGIPHFVLVDADSFKVITLDGRSHVSRDPYGVEFPWGSRGFSSVVPRPLRKMTRNYVSKISNRLQNVLKGMLSQLAPDKLVQFTYRAVTNVVKLLYYLLKKTVIAT
jgi:nucleoredoxin